MIDISEISDDDLACAGLHRAFDDEVFIGGVGPLSIERNNALIGAVAAATDWRRDRAEGRVPLQRHRAPVLPPAALNREDAAAYVSMSGNGFDDAVKAGAMPQPRTHGRRLIWIRAELDAALLQMPIRGQSANPSHQDDADPLADWM